MPTYKLPKLKKRDREKEEVAMSHDGMDQFPDKWDREIRIPVNKDILEGLTVGTEAEIMLRGEVKGLTNDEQEGRPDRRFLTVMIAEVSAYGEDAEAEFEEGYQDGPRAYRRA